MHADPDNEFADFISWADADGLPGGRPAVRRAWVNVPTGGHVSAVIWGQAQPEIVLLHDARRSARAWDAVALEIGRPVVAIDLPGHGRSNWRRDGRYEPRKLAPAVAEAIRSFAPRARLVAGEGLGGLTALALAQRHAALLPVVALVDTLPATELAAGSRPADLSAAPPRFAAPEEAWAVLADSHLDWPDPVLRQEVRAELDAESDGLWAWRHHPGNLPDGDGPAFDDPSLWAELAGLGSAVSLIRAERLARLAQADIDALSVRAPGADTITIPGVSQDLTVHAPGALAAWLGELAAAPGNPAQAGAIPSNR